MSDFVSSFTIFRDILLLAVNIGMLVMLFIIAGQMNSQRQRSKALPKQVTELLEKILASQRKAASALATNTNEFRNHLKTMVINVESTDLTKPDTPPGKALRPGDFKTLRRNVERLEKNVSDTLQSLQSLSRQSTESLDKLVAGFRSDRQEDRELVKEFQNSLRADLGAQADRIRKAVTELPPTRDGNGPAAAPVEVSTTALDNSLQEWLGRTRELHESLVTKIQTSGHAAGNGNGKEPALEGLQQTVASHHDSMQKLLSDFMSENIRQTRSTEEFRSEMRNDFRNHNELLSRAVSDMSGKVTSAAGGSSSAPPTAPVQFDLEGPFNRWLDRTRQLHESLVGEVRNATSRIEFPTDEFRLITDQHNDSLRKLLEGWTDESVRRVRATDELRAAIQQDVKTQADRLRQLVDSHPAPAPTTGTVTTGTVTASAGDGESREWHDSVQAELATIIGKLDRMHDRMEEIFQI
jgi:hypothetical protein